MLNTAVRYLPLGYSQITSLSAAAGLGTIPAGANVAVIEAATHDVRWRDDGVDPSTTVGMPLTAGSVLEYSGSLSSIKFVELAASANLNVSFYKIVG